MAFHLIEDATQGCANLMEVLLPRLRTALDQCVVSPGQSSHIPSWIMPVYRSGSYLWNAAVTVPMHLVVATSALLCRGKSQRFASRARSCSRSPQTNLQSRITVDCLLKFPGVQPFEKQASSSTLAAAVLSRHCQFLFFSRGWIKEGGSKGW